MVEHATQVLAVGSISNRFGWISFQHCVHFGTNMCLKARVYWTRLNNKAVS